MDQTYSVTPSPSKLVVGRLPFLVAPCPNIIGSGNYGTVVSPPIDCGQGAQSIPPNSVGKIATLDVLQTELDFINLFIANNKTYAKHVSKEQLRLCKLDYDKLSKYIQENFDKRDRDNIYQLIMPNLGITLATFMQQFENICSKGGKVTVSRSQLMTMEMLKRMSEALRVLYNEIEEMNQKHIYHRDIKPNNLIYNLASNTLVMIDFNLAITTQIPDKYAPTVIAYQELEDRLDFVEKVLIPILLIAFSNHTIFTQLNTLYQSLYTLMHTDVHIIKQKYTPVDHKMIRTLQKNLNTSVLNIFRAIENMDSDILSDERNSDDSFCREKFVNSVAVQRSRAVLRETHLRNITKEQQNMASYDDASTTFPASSTDASVLRTSTSGSKKPKGGRGLTAKVNMSHNKLRKHTSKQKNKTRKTT